MQSAAVYQTQEIDPAKLRTLGFELGHIEHREIRSIYLVAQQREIPADCLEALEILERCRRETLAERAQELLGITLAIGIFVVAIPLFTGWAAI